MQVEAEVEVEADLSEKASSTTAMNRFSLMNVMSSVKLAQQGTAALVCAGSRSVSHLTQNGTAAPEPHPSTATQHPNARAASSRASRAPAPAVLKLEFEFELKLMLKWLLLFSAPPCRR